MLSFHNDLAVKKKYLDRVRSHQKADNLVKGATGNGGKGCAVACTLDMVYDHSRYPIELGIPEWLARVEDALFEGMNLKKSKTWPEVFLKSIPVGVDLGPVKTKFVVMLLEHTLVSMKSAKYDEKKNPEVKAAIDQSIAVVNSMISAQKSGDKNLISAAESAAWSAAWSAARAAWSAAGRAAWSAASAARSAARSAAGSAAWSAAESAESAERSAARAAWSAAGSAAWSAESAAHDYYADELVQMLKACRKKGKK